MIAMITYFMYMFLQTLHHFETACYDNHDMPLPHNKRRNLNAFTSQYKHCMDTMVHAIYYTDAELVLVQSIFF